MHHKNPAKASKKSLLARNKRPKPRTASRRSLHNQGTVSSSKTTSSHQSPHSDLDEKVENNTHNTDFSSQPATNHHTVCQNKIQKKTTPHSNQNLEQFINAYTPSTVSKNPTPFSPSHHGDNTMPIPFHLSTNSTNSPLSYPPHATPHSLLSKHIPTSNDQPLLPSHLIDPSTSHNTPEALSTTTQTTPKPTPKPTPSPAHIPLKLNPNLHLTEDELYLLGPQGKAKAVKNVSNAAKLQIKIVSLKAQLSLTKKKHFITMTNPRSYLHSAQIKHEFDLKCLELEKQIKSVQLLQKKLLLRAIVEVPIKPTHDSAKVGSNQSINSSFGDMNTGLGNQNDQNDKNDGDFFQFLTSTCGNIQSTDVHTLPKVVNNLTHSFQNDNPKISSKSDTTPLQKELRPRKLQPAKTSPQLQSNTPVLDFVQSGKVGSLDHLDEFLKQELLSQIEQNDDKNITTHSKRPQTLTKSQKIAIRTAILSDPLATRALARKLIIRQALQPDFKKHTPKSTQSQIMDQISLPIGHNAYIDNSRTKLAHLGQYSMNLITISKQIKKIQSSHSKSLQKLYKKRLQTTTPISISPPPPQTLIPHHIPPQLSTPTAPTPDSNFPHLLTTPSKKTPFTTTRRHAPQFRPPITGGPLSRTYNPWKGPMDFIKHWTDPGQPRSRNPMNRFLSGMPRGWNAQEFGLDLANFQAPLGMHKSFLKSIPHVYVNFWVKWAALWQLPPIPFAIPPPPFFLLPTEYKKWFFTTWRWAFKVYYFFAKMALKPFYYFVPRNLKREGVAKDITFSLPEHTHPDERNYLVKLDNAMSNKKTRLKSALLYDHSSQYVVPWLHYLPGKRPWLFFTLLFGRMSHVFADWQRVFTDLNIPMDMTVGSVRLDLSKEPFSELVKKFRYIQDLFHLYTINDATDFTIFESAYASVSHIDLQHMGSNILLTMLFGVKVYRYLGPVGFSILWVISSHFAFLANSYYQRRQGRSQTATFLEQVLMQQADVFSPAEVQHIQDVLYRPALGASGAVVGIMTALACLFPKDKIRVFGLPIPVPVVVSTFILAEGLSLHMQTIEGIDHSGHLGGAVGGLAALVLMWYLPLLGKNTPFIKYGTNLPIMDWIRGKPRIKDVNELDIKRWQPEETYHQQIIELYKNISWKGYLHDPRKYLTPHTAKNHKSKRVRYMWSSYWDPNNGGGGKIISLSKKSQIRAQIESQLTHMIPLDIMNPDITTTGKPVGPIMRIKRPQVEKVDISSYKQNVQKRAVQRLIYKHRTKATSIMQHQWNAMSNSTILFDVPAPLPPEVLKLSKKELQNPSLTQYYDTFGEAISSNQLGESFDDLFDKNCQKLTSLGLLQPQNEDQYKRTKKIMSPDEFIIWDRKRMDKEIDNEAEQARENFFKVVKIIQDNLYAEAISEKPTFSARVLRFLLSVRQFTQSVSQRINRAIQRMYARLSSHGSLLLDYSLLSLQRGFNQNNGRTKMGFFRRMFSSQNPLIQKFLKFLHQTLSNLKFTQNLIANRKLDQLDRLERQLSRRNPFVHDRDLDYLLQQHYGTLITADPTLFSPYRDMSPLEQFSHDTEPKSDKNAPNSNLPRKKSFSLPRSLPPSRLSSLRSRLQSYLPGPIDTIFGSNAFKTRGDDVIKRKLLPDWYSEFDYLSPPVIFDESGTTLVPEDSETQSFPYQVYVLHHIAPPDHPGFTNANNEDLMTLFKQEVEDRQVFQKALSEYDQGFLAPALLQEIAERVKLRDRERKEQVVGLKAIVQERLLQDERFRSARIQSTYFTELENLERFVQDHRVRLQDDKRLVLDQAQELWLAMPQNRIEQRLQEHFRDGSTEDEIHRGRRLLKKLLELDPSKGLLPLFNQVSIQVKPIPGMEIVDPYQILVDLQLKGPSTYDAMSIPTARLTNTEIEVKFPTSHHNRRLFFPSSRAEAMQNRVEILARCPDYFDKRSKVLYATKVSATNLTGGEKPKGSVAFDNDNPIGPKINSKLVSFLTPIIGPSRVEALIPSYFRTQRQPPTGLVTDFKLNPLNPLEEASQFTQPQALWEKYHHTSNLDPQLEPDEFKLVPELGWESPEYKEYRVTTNEQIAIKRQKRMQFLSYMNEKNREKERHIATGSGELDYDESLNWQKIKSSKLSDLYRYFSFNTKRYMKRVVLVPPTMVMKMLENSKWLQDERKMEVTKGLNIIDSGAQSDQKQIEFRSRFVQFEDVSDEKKGEIEEKIRQRNLKNASTDPHNTAKSTSPQPSQSSQSSQSSTENKYRAQSNSAHYEADDLKKKYAELEIAEEFVKGIQQIKDEEDFYNSGARQAFEKYKEEMAKLDEEKRLLRIDKRRKRRVQLEIDEAADEEAMAHGIPIPSRNEHRKKKPKKVVEENDPNIGTILEEPTEYETESDEAEINRRKDKLRDEFYSLLPEKNLEEIRRQERLKKSAEKKMMKNLFTTDPLTGRIISEPEPRRQNEEFIGYSIGSASNTPSPPHLVINEAGQVKTNLKTHFADVDADSNSSIIGNNITNELYKFGKSVERGVYDIVNTTLHKLQPPVGDNLINNVDNVDNVVNADNNKNNNQNNITKPQNTPQIISTTDGPERRVFKQRGATYWNSTGTFDPKNPLLTKLYLRQDGSIRHVFVNDHPLIGVPDSELNLVGLPIDITTQKARMGTEWTHNWDKKEAKKARKEERLRKEALGVPLEENDYGDDSGDSDDDADVEDGEVKKGEDDDDYGKKTIKNPFSPYNVTKDQVRNIHKAEFPSISSYQQQKLFAHHIVTTRHRRFSTVAHPNGDFDHQNVQHNQHLVQKRPNNVNPSRFTTSMVPKSAQYDIDAFYCLELGLPQPERDIHVNQQSAQINPKNSIKMNPPLQQKTTQQKAQQKAQKFRNFKQKLMSFLQSPKTLILLTHPYFVPSTIERIRNTPRYKPN